MKSVKIDFHIHTALTLGADLDLTPSAIVERATELKLDVIGITDYNSTKQAVSVQKVAEEKGLFVLVGAEVISAEGIHLLLFVDGEDKVDALQKFLDQNLSLTNKINTEDDYQVLFDEFDEMIMAEEVLLFQPLKADIYQICQIVNDLAGIIIAVGVDRSSKSILSELGVIPPQLRINGLESFKTSVQKIVEQSPELSLYPFVRGSNAKNINTIGKGITIIDLQELSFKAIKDKLSLNAEHDIKII